MGLLHRIKDPVDGVMHVVGCSHVDPKDLRGPCTIVYTLASPGLPTVSGQQVFEVSSSKWPHPEQDLPVTFDREKPDRITIHWDRLESTADIAMRHAGELAAAGGGETAAAAAVPLPIQVIGSPSAADLQRAMAAAANMMGANFAGGGGFAAAAPSNVTQLDVGSELERLAALLNQGLLTREEFDAQKARLLSSP